jgi:predicted DNA-binding transcriptional regulator AlpA
MLFGTCSSFFYDTISTIFDIMEILLKDDVMNRLKISEATLYRWVNESRNGMGTFPLPVSLPKRTLRWNSDAIDAWCQAQHIPPVRKPKTKKQDQKAMSTAMQRHRLGDSNKR